MQNISINGFNANTLASRSIENVCGDTLQIILHQNDCIMESIDEFISKNEFASAIVKYKRIDIGADKIQSSDKYQYIDCNNESIMNIFEAFDIKSGVDIIEVDNGNVAFLAHGQIYTHGENKAHYQVETYAEIKLFSGKVDILCENCSTNTEIEDVLRNLYKLSSMGSRIKVADIKPAPDIEEVFAIHREFEEEPYSLYRINSFDNPVIRKVNLPEITNTEKKEAKKSFDKFCKKYHHNYKLVSYEELEKLSVKAQNEINHLFCKRKKTVSR